MNIINDIDSRKLAAVGIGIPRMLVVLTLLTLPILYPADVMGDNAIPASVGITSVQFVVYGDSRSNPEEHRKIVDLIIGSGTKIVFHAGDLVAEGNSTSDWESFNNVVDPLLRVAEFYPALGDHEGNSPLYFANFHLPNNERWYSIRKDGISFIILDSNSDLSPTSEQFHWLEEEVSRANMQDLFTVVLFHHPPFTTGPHQEDEKGLRRYVIPLLERNGVEIVFNGHVHAYERSYNNGIHYIVTGGGGAPLYSQVRTTPSSKKFISVFHFCRVRKDRGQLFIEAIGDSGEVIDQFSVRPRPEITGHAYGVDDRQEQIPLGSQ